MSKDFYIRTLTFGRYRKVVRYSRVQPRDDKPVRNAKQAATTAAQKFINIKNSTERLQMLLCANFDCKEACFCTFTFAPDKLPANQKHTNVVFAAFLRKLRADWKKHDRPLKYIYTVEGAPLSEIPTARPVAGQQWEIAPWKDRPRWAEMDNAQEAQEEEDTRLHIHCFLILHKQDYETVRAFWPYGQVYINRMQVNELTSFQRLAAYVTKEKRTGDKANGARAYIPSKNLEQPVSSGHWCTEYEGLQLPQGAEEIRSGSERDDVYGTSVEYIWYRMPRPKPKAKPYKSKGSLKNHR